VDFETSKLILTSTIKQARHRFYDRAPPLHLGKD
jgi:hypothetical protein